MFKVIFLNELDLDEGHENLLQTYYLPNEDVMIVSSNNLRTIKDNKGKYWLVFKPIS